MKIHYISPYRSDKNIGKAINDAIKNICPLDDDWIVHVDQDVCFLRPDSKAQIAEILSNTTFDVLGCMTNRLSSPHQLYKGKFSESADIREHINIADQLHNSNYGVVNPTGINIAAMLMCFRVSTWQKTGGFREGSIRFDSEFTDSVQNLGGNLGIMAGVYVFHLYRMWSEKPIYAIEHLVK